MKGFLLYSIFILFFACNHAQVSESKTVDSKINDTILDSVQVQNDFDSTQTGLNFNKGNNYQNTKNEMLRLRSALSNEYNLLNDSLSKSEFLDSASSIFSDKLLNEIIPYWYGTEWDFEGYTSVPNQGKIACGYFVSTTLRDMGLNINRYKLAQRSPVEEAEIIACDLNLFSKIQDMSIHKITAMFKYLEPGLYFVGLDNHVGYLLKNENGIFFLHSNYLENRVMVEEALNSFAFRSGNYYVSPISGNRSLILHWILNKEVPVN